MTQQRKAARQHQQRQRRDQREQAKALQERARRQAVPVRDDGPLPRID